MPRCRRKKKNFAFYSILIDGTNIEKQPKRSTINTRMKYIKEVYRSFRCSQTLELELLVIFSPLLWRWSCTSPSTGRVPKESHLEEYTNWSSFWRITEVQEMFNDLCKLLNPFTQHFLRTLDWKEKRKRALKDRNPSLNKPTCMNYYLSFQGQLNKSD